MSIDPAAELARVRAELDEVSRRDAAFRLKTTQDHLSTEARVRDLEQRILNLDTYVHHLHLERDDLRQQVHAARADVEAFAWMLHEREHDKRVLTAAKKSLLWPLVSSRAKAPAAPARALAAPPAEFTYFLHTSPFRLYRPGSFVLRGWVLPKGGQAITGVRVAIDEKTFLAKSRLPEPDVVQRHPDLAHKNPLPGFEVTFEVEDGRHEFSLEAQLDNREWRSVLIAPIWCRKD